MSFTKMALSPIFISMNSLTLTFSGKEIEIPFKSEWDELTTDELKFVIEAQQQDYSMPRIFAKLVENSARENKIKLPYNWASRLNKQQAAIIALDGLKFLYDENKLTKFPFKLLVVDSVALIGCGDQFTDFTCRQMEGAFPQFLLFKEKVKIEHLHEMCACFFSLADNRHDTGERITEKSVAEMLPIMQKLDLTTLLCCYTWYAGCLQLLPQRFPELYDTPEGEQQEFNYTQFTHLIHNGTGERNGSRENIRAMRLLEFLFDLWLQKTEAKKLEPDAINE